MKVKVWARTQKGAVRIVKPKGYVVTSVKTNRKTHKKYGLKVHTVFMKKR